MFFNSSGHRKKGGGLGGILRLFLSLIIMAILGLGLLQAFRSFSGTDPLTVDPKTTFKSLLTSEGVYQFLTGLLTASPDESINKAKELFQTNNSSKNNTNITSNSNSTTNDGVILYKFAVVADSHKDTRNLLKALEQAKSSGSEFVIGIGDFSDIGTIEELSNSKKQFDAVGLNYYVIPGDHDLWDSRDKGKAPDQNFRDVFGQPSYQDFSFENTRFYLLYNTDNYIGLDGVELNWIEDSLKRNQVNPSKLKLAFVGTPLYHPSSDHVMGKVTPKLKNQAAHLASLFKKNNIQEVFAGDAHFFSTYKDPEEDLKMTVVGAITSEKNAQAPRFALVDVYEDGSYNIQDTEIK